MDYWSNFAQLMKEDPFAARMYGDMVPAGNQGFLQGNQGRIQQEFFGGDTQKYNQWVNENSAGGSVWNQRGGNALDVVNPQLYQRLQGMVKPTTPWMAAQQRQAPTGLPTPMGRETDGSMIQRPANNPPYWQPPQTQWLHNGGWMGGWSHNSTSPLNFPQPRPKTPMGAVNGTPPPVNSPQQTLNTGGGGRTPATIARPMAKRSVF